MRASLATLLLLACVTSRGSGVSVESHDESETLVGEKPASEQQVASPSPQQQQQRQQQDQSSKSKQESHQQEGQRAQRGRHQKQSRQQQQQQQSQQQSGQGEQQEATASPHPSQPPTKERFWKAKPKPLVLKQDPRSPVCRRNPWNCECFDCAKHSNEANRLQLAKAQRTAWLRSWVHQAQDRTRSVVDGARVAWGIDSMRAAVARLRNEAKARKPASARVEGTTKGRERAQAATTMAKIRLDSAQRSLRLAREHLARTRKTAREAGAANTRRLADARREHNAKLAALKATHAAAMKKKAAALNAAMRAHSAAVKTEGSFLTTLAGASALLKEAQLNATPPKVWQARVAKAEKAVDALGAKQDAEVAAERARIATVNAAVTARLGKMRKLHARAMKANKLDAESKKETAKLQLAQIRQATSFVRSASEPVQLTLQGLQAQLNDVAIAVAAARALAAANNASVLKALEKPNAWIKAATAQLVAANATARGFERSRVLTEAAAKVAEEDSARMRAELARFNEAAKTNASSAERSALSTKDETARLDKLMAQRKKEAAAAVAARKAAVKADARLRAKVTRDLGKARAALKGARAQLTKAMHEKKKALKEGAKLQAAYEKAKKEVQAEYEKAVAAAKAQAMRVAKEAQRRLAAAAADASHSNSDRADARLRLQRARDRLANTTVARGKEQEKLAKLQGIARVAEQARREKLARIVAQTAAMQEALKGQKAKTQRMRSQAERASSDLHAKKLYVSGARQKAHGAADTAEEAGLKGSEVEAKLTHVAGYSKRVAGALAKFAAIRSATTKVNAEVKKLRSRASVAAAREAGARAELATTRASAAEVQRQLDMLARRVQRRRQLGFPESAADLPARTAALEAEVNALRRRRDATKRIIERMTSREGMTAAAAGETAELLAEAEGISHSTTPSPSPSPSAGPLGMGSPVSLDPSTGAIVPDGTPGAVLGRIVEVIRGRARTTGGPASPGVAQAAAAAGSAPAIR